jgi:hypothetical protein
MPHQKGRLAKSADKKNTKLLVEVVAGKETVFARVEANLGPQFRIVVFDKDTKKIIKAFAISRKPKHHLPLKINDIVLLSAVPNDGEVGEIMGRVGTAGEKETKSLYDEGRIHASVYNSSNGCSEGMAKALNDIFETAEGEREDIWDEGKGDEKRDAAKIDIDAI